MSMILDAIKRSKEGPEGVVLSRLSILSTM